MAPETDKLNLLLGIRTCLDKRNINKCKVGNKNLTESTCNAKNSQI